MQDLNFAVSPKDLFMCDIMELKLKLFYMEIFLI